MAGVERSDPPDGPKSWGLTSFDPSHTKYGGVLKRLLRKRKWRQGNRGFRENFKYALVWGPPAKHPGQRVGISHRLRDGDVFFVHGK